MSFSPLTWACLMCKTYTFSTQESKWMDVFSNRQCLRNQIAYLMFQVACLVGKSVKISWHAWDGGDGRACPAPSPICAILVRMCLNGFIPSANMSSELLKLKQKD